MFLMGIKEYAETRNVSERLLRSLVAEGKIAAGRVGRKWMLDVERVDEFFVELTTPKPLPKATKGFDFMAALKEARRKTA